MIPPAFILALLAGAWCLVWKPPFVRAAQTVVVSEADCRWLMRHVPREDVHYRPGVDVRGRKVAPADLEPEPQPKIPEKISVDLTIPLRVFLKEDTPPRLGDAEVKVGSVTVDRDTGNVSYNGQSLTDRRQEQLVAHCRKLVDERKQRRGK